MGRGEEEEGREGEEGEDEGIAQEGGGRLAV